MCQSNSTKAAASAHVVMFIQLSSTSHDQHDVIEHALRIVTSREHNLVYHRCRFVRFNPVCCQARHNHRQSIMHYRAYNVAIFLSTLRPKPNGCHFCSRYFHRFFCIKIVEYSFNFTEIYYQGSNFLTILQNWSRSRWVNLVITENKLRGNGSNYTHFCRRKCLSRCRSLCRLSRACRFVPFSDDSHQCQTDQCQNDPAEVGSRSATVCAVRVALVAITAQRAFLNESVINTWSVYCAVFAFAYFI